jgi:hypothetical protein
MSSLTGISSSLAPSSTVVDDIKTNTGNIDTNTSNISINTTIMDGYTTSLSNDTTALLLDTAALLSDTGDILDDFLTITNLNDVTDLTTFTSRINLTAISWDGYHYAKKLRVIDGGGGLLFVTTGGDQLRLIEVATGDEIAATNIKAIHQATNVGKLRVWWSTGHENTETIPFVPTDVTGAALWFRSDFGITLNGSDVLKWLDLSGNGKNATQGTAADQPEYLPTGGVNGLPGVSFDQGNSEFLNLTGLAETSNDYTMFLIFDEGSGNTNQGFLGVNVGGGTVACFASNADAGEFWVSSYDGAFTRRMAQVTTGEQYLEWQWDSGSSEHRVYRNGEQIGSGVYGSPSTLANNGFIGRHPSVATYYLEGTVSEIIVYNKVLSAAELTQVRNYINSRYSLSFSPLNLADNLLWLDASLGITLDGSNVSTWADQSGNNNDATQGIAARRPEYGATAGVSGLPGIIFDESNTKWMDITGLANASNDWTILCVLNQGTLTGNPQDIICHQTGPVVHAATRITFDFVGGYDSTSWRQVAAVLLGDQLLGWVWDSSGPTITVSRNGSDINFNTYDGTISMAGSAAIGAFWDGSQQWFNGVLSEIIIYPRILTTEELTSLNAYLLAKYSL